LEIIKTLLAGCGALALLSVVGCVGLVGAGGYAIDQAIEEERAREAALAGSRASDRRNYGEDPFSDYQGQNSTNDGESNDNWGERDR